MTCEKCSMDRKDKPITIISSPDGDTWICANCSDPIVSKTGVPEIEELISSGHDARWDEYFLNITNVVASNSKCHSRKIGAILVRDKSIISTGYNGPARGVPHCGTERLLLDHKVRSRIYETIEPPDNSQDCPRRLLGYGSGDGLDWCIAAHAEQNCIANAAKLGVSTEGSTMYMNTQVACKNCLVNIINAGVIELVITDMKAYDMMGEFIVSHSPLTVRLFRYPTDRQ